MQTRQKLFVDIDTCGDPEPARYARRLLSAAFIWQGHSGAADRIAVQDYLYRIGRVWPAYQSNDHEIQQKEVYLMG